MLLSTVRPHSFGGVRMSIADMSRPLLSVAAFPFQSFYDFIHAFGRMAQIQAKNERLERENVKLRTWYQVALLLESENKALRDLMNIESVQDYEYVGARVLSDSGNTYVQSLLVSAGVQENISKGSAVLSADGLVGRVIDVGEKTSRILLVTDINSRIPVVIADTGQHAILAGANNFSPRLEHLPKETQLSEGARVVTSGYGGVYPPGIPVGIVRYNDHKVPTIQLFADLARLQILRIVGSQKTETVLSGRN